MEISVVILSEEEVRQAVALWLKIKMTPAPAVIRQVKPVRHKRQALVYAVSVQCVDVVDEVEDDAGGDSFPEEG